MVFQFQKLSNYTSLKHFITTREGGTSSGNYKWLNLSYNVNDNAKTVEANMKFVAQQLSLEPQLLFFPDQCHTANVVCIDKLNLIGEFKETDALITNIAGIGIGVLAADCVPILFFDPINKVVGAAHAGWKGTVKLIVKEVIEMMTKIFGSDPSLIIAGIGPAISQTNYEVDYSVIQQVNKSANKPERFYKSSKKEGRYLLNLQALNYQLLLDAGLLETNLERLQLCTYDRADLFFSARRDGFNTGRFGAVIRLKDE